MLFKTTSRIIREFLPHPKNSPLRSHSAVHTAANMVHLAFFCGEHRRSLWVRVYTCECVCVSTIMTLKHLFARATFGAVGLIICVCVCGWYAFYGEKFIMISCAQCRGTPKPYTNTRVAGNSIICCFSVAKWANYVCLFCIHCKRKFMQTHSEYSEQIA